METHRDPQLNNMKGMRGFWILSPDRIFSSNLSLQGSGNYETMKKRGIQGCKTHRWCMTSRKQQLPNTTGLMHIWTHRDLWTFSLTLFFFNLLVFCLYILFLILCVCVLLYISWLFAFFFLKKRVLFVWFCLFAKEREKEEAWSWVGVEVGKV